MAKEYRQYNHNHNNLEFEDYQITLAKRNEPYYPNGHTGYEQYYIDLEGFGVNCIGLMIIPMKMF